MWNGKLVLLVAHLLFDGEISSRGCIYTNRSLVLHNRVQRNMRTVYPFPPKKYESTPGVYKTSYYNVELAIYLQVKATELLATIEDMRMDHQRVFLRAFFDDEGSMYFIGTRRAVRGFQHDEKILNLISRLLKNFNIESSVDTKYSEVTITRRENIKSFAREVNFTPGVCVNGKRKNSTWKQSFQKREILERALASYEK